MHNSSYYVIEQIGNQQYHIGTNGEIQTSSYEMRMVDNILWRKKYYRKQRENKIQKQQTQLAV